ncbi:hypothetical protein HKD37_18G050537 [Glycine soja]
MEEVNMNKDNREEPGVFENIDCSNAFNTSQVFATCDDVLHWVRSIACDIGFMVVIMKLDIDTGKRRRTSYVLIGCERSEKYKTYKKDLVRIITSNRKCRCPFKLQAKPMLEGEGRLTEDEKIIIGDMTKSMVKPKNILLTLKEHNANSCTTIKQVCNARYAYCSSIRSYNMKLTNAYNLVYLIDSTYKTNRYKLSSLDIVAAFAYLEGEHVNNVVWALEQFRGIFLRRDAIPLVIVIDRDSKLMNAMKNVFHEATNLLCRFYIDKNVKAKCKILVGQKNAWDYVMEAWRSLMDCLSEQEFDDCLMKFEITCLTWPMFVDYVKQTWLIPHMQRFVKVWMNKVMHLGNTTTNRVQSAHWALKRLLQISLGDLCSVWEAMNNIITLQHTEIKSSFETSTHVVGHIFKFTLYKRLIGMVSSCLCGCIMRTSHGLPCARELARYVLGSIPLDTIHMFSRRLSFSDQGLSEFEVSIIEEMEAISKRFKELDVCGKVTLKRDEYAFFYMFLSSRHEVGCDTYPDLNSMCAPPKKEYVDALHSVQSSNSLVKRCASSSEQPKPNRKMPMLDQFQPCIHDFIENIVDVKVDGNFGYHAIVGLLGMGEDSWSLVHNHLLKELGQWSDEYIHLLGGMDRCEELKRSLLVDEISKVTMDKWMNITDMDYVIASRYNVILSFLSLQQSMTFFSLRSQPPRNSFVHHIICIDHVYGNHFVYVFLRDGYPLPPTAFLWSTYCHHQAKQ